MLKPTSELPEQERFNAWMLGWVAVDKESGAYLFSSNGRQRKLTALKYYLILPDKPVHERRSLFTNCSFGYPYGRKIVRAWSDEEAIAEANKRLPKMIEQQAAAQAAQP